MVLPSFFNLSLNLAIRILWSETQSAPSLVFADYIEFLHSVAKNIINLISVLAIWWCPCVESSFVLLEEVVCYDQCFPLAKCYPLPCFILYSKAKFACYFRYLLTSFFCIPVPYDEKDIFFCVLVLEGLICVKSLSRVQLFATPWTIAYQAPPSMRFSRQEYWSGLPFPSPEDLSHPGIEPRCPAL